MDPVNFEPSLPFISRFCGSSHYSQSLKLREAQSQADHHFNQRALSVLAIRSRSPPECANPLTLLSSHRNFSQIRPIANRPFCVTLGLEQRASRHSEVLSLLAECADLSPPLLSFAGLLSSLYLHDEANEAEFLELIRSSHCDSADQPHFYHLADELADMTAARIWPPLLKLVCGRIDHIISNPQKFLHAPPIMGAPESTQTCLRPFKYSFPRSGTVKEKQFPELVPVVEGFDADVRTDDTRDVVELLCDRELAMAIAKATKLIQINPNRADLPLQRALALLWIGKEIDALADLENSLKLEDVSTTRQLRDALIARVVGLKPKRVLVLR
jgi:hypothetical protein